MSLNGKKGVGHCFGHEHLVCSCWIGESSRNGLDLPIQAEQGGPNDDHSRKKRIVPLRSREP